MPGGYDVSPPAARAGSAYAAARLAIVSWAFSPLGFGTTHSSAPRRAAPAADRAWPAPAERGPVRRDAGDRDHHRPVRGDERRPAASALPAARPRSARRRGPSPG